MMEPKRIYIQSTLLVYESCIQVQIYQVMDHGFDFNLLFYFANPFCRMKILTILIKRKLLKINQCLLDPLKINLNIVNF